MGEGREEEERREEKRRGEMERKERRETVSAAEGVDEVCRKEVYALVCRLHQLDESVPERVLVLVGHTGGEEAGQRGVRKWFRGWRGGEKGREKMTGMHIERTGRRKYSMAMSFSCFPLLSSRSFSRSRAGKSFCRSGRDGRER